MRRTYVIFKCYDNNLIDEAVFEQRPNGLKGIAQSNLLALIVIARVESNRYFENPHAALQYLCREFRFKFKSLGMQGNILNNLFLENFISRFHIRQDGVVKNIRHQGEQFVGNHMPKHSHPTRRTQKA